MNLPILIMRPASKSRSMMLNTRLRLGFSMLGTIRMCIVWFSGAMMDESLVGLVLDGVFIAVVADVADLDDLLPNNVELPSDLLNDVLFAS